jgi:hypothetical protein
MGAVSVSGISTMSDSLMAFQPAIEEPSNIRPSANMSRRPGDIHRHVLHLAARIGEAKVDELDLVVLDVLQNVISVLICLPFG